MQPRKRHAYIDIAKGLGMLTIIWGHVLESGFSHNLVYSFHIPLFFFLSGMVFDANKYQSIRQFLNRKLRTLMIPYVIFSGVTWGVWVGYNYFMGGKVSDIFAPLLQTFVAQGSEGYLVHNVPLWFVSCLLVIEIIYFFVGRSKTKIVLVSCAGFALLSYVMELYTDVFDFTKLPWSIGTAFAGIVFYAVGHKLATSGIIERVWCKVAEGKQRAQVVLVLVTAVLMLLSAANGKVSMGHEYYGYNRLLFYINGFLGIFCVIEFSFILEHGKNTKWLVGLKWIGMNSLYFMVLENPIKGVVVQFYSRMLGTNTAFIKSNFGYCIPAFILTTFVTIVTVYTLTMLIRKVRMIKTGR